MTRVSVDPEICQAAAFYVGTVPAVFTLGPDSIVALNAGQRLDAGPIDVPPELVELVRTARGYCPSGAIEVSEE
ncbi:ferredoxin [Nocardia sp. NPDC051030]|uniref:ferredoxin n=1 Tax=Nocardia sp. NPDC051030 TaxID=3155162 RepID=UPI0034363E7D